MLKKTNSSKNHLGKNINKKKRDQKPFKQEINNNKRNKKMKI